MEIAAITHGALLGLAYLHSHNMIHRWVGVFPYCKQQKKTMTYQQLGEFRDAYLEAHLFLPFAALTALPITPHTCSSCSLIYIGYIIVIFTADIIEEQ